MYQKLQRQLVGYMYYSMLDDPITFKAVRNHTDYIKLIIAAKRKLLAIGMVFLPYVISSRIIRIANKKVVSKKELLRYQNASLFNQLKDKYSDEKVINKIWELIGSVTSSSFEIIDYDPVNHKPTDIDGKTLPMINDIINEEMQFFISTI